MIGQMITDLMKWQILISLLEFIAYAFLFGFITNKVIQRTPKYNKDDEKIPIYQIIVLVVMSMMLFFLGFTIEFVKGSVFLLILLYASICDIQTHEVKDFVSVLIFITAFIGKDISKLTAMILSGAVVFGMLLLCAVISNNRIGGADVKLSAACAFLLGLKGGIAGLVIGLILAVLCNLIFNRKEKNKAFPLVPYLSVGYMVMFGIENRIGL